ncbi:MAG: hypothetical protein K8R89_07135 [Anaerolineae bacterium]|nr:hypothetical protein [Anaerolineae bacterium]
MKDSLREYLKVFAPLFKFLESKLGRIAVTVGLVSLVAEIILDSLDAENAMRVSEFGCLGTILALGIGVLCILLNDNDTPPHMVHSFDNLDCRRRTNATAFAL